jgi:hypothetical protein
MNPYNFFVATSPYQIINTLNISVEKKKSALLVVDSFIDAEKIYNKIKDKKLFRFTLFFSSEKDCYKWILQNQKYCSNVYIDSDINKMKLIFPIRRLNIYVYEEGIGTYSKKHYYPTRFILGNLRLYFLRMLGYKNRRGGDRYVKGLFLYRPDFYKKNTYKKANVNGFKCDLIEHLEYIEELGIFEKPKDFTIYKDKKVALYIGSWVEQHDDFFKLVSNNDVDFIVYKPHPHLKNVSNVSHYDLIVDGLYPAELLILNLIKNVKELLVLSQYSTSMIYFENDPMVTHHKLNFNKPEYKNLYNLMVKDING